MNYNSSSYQLALISTSSSSITIKCSEWEKIQNGLFTTGNALYAVSLLIPHHHTYWRIGRYYSIFLGRILASLAHLFFALWASLVLCSPDVFLWQVLMLCTSAVHVAYWGWRYRPERARIRHPALLELYHKLFLPLDAGADQFVQLTQKSLFRKLESGDEYFAAFDPSTHPLRLSILLSGKLNVSFGSRLLHHISPFQFVDSPEWYATQNAFPHDLKASKPQVAVEAAEASTILQLDPDHLAVILNSNPRLNFLLHCLIGKDVSEKLYAVAEYSQSLIIMTNKQSNSSAGGGTSRLSSLQVSGAGSNASAGGRAAIFNHWESELARSQSADAVHTSKQGQLRSIHWRRDQTHKIWARKYEKLVPSHHRQMSSLLRPDHQLQRNRRLSSDPAAAAVIMAVHPAVVPSIIKEETTTGINTTNDAKSSYKHRRSSQKSIQFGETFV